MSLTVKQVNQTDIDYFVKDQSINVPIEQTYIWQKFDSKVQGRRALGVFGFYNNDSVVAIAAITEYRNSKYNWWWVKYGPVFIGSISDDQKIKIITLIEQMAKDSKNNIVFIRATLPNLNIKLHKQLQHMIYDRTIIINLQLHNNAEKLLNSYTRHGRYEVRQSLKKGVICLKISNQNTIKNFDLYYKILSETAKRDNFYALPKNSYIQMLSTMPNNCLFYLAEYNKQPVSWAIVTNFGGYAKYYYAAGNNIARQTGAAYALQYFIMQDLVKQGIKKYDLMGIASDEFPELWSVTGFKKKFSKNIIDIDKTYDIVCSPLKYSVIKGLKKAKKVASKIK